MPLKQINIACSYWLCQILFSLYDNILCVSIAAKRPTCQYVLQKNDPVYGLSRRSASHSPSNCKGSNGSVPSGEGANGIFSGECIPRIRPRIFFLPLQSRLHHESANNDWAYFPLFPCLHYDVISCGAIQFLSSQTLLDQYHAGCPLNGFAAGMGGGQGLCC